ncbi:MAG: formate dehydrogenase accessory sulfurtransferase FdhD [Acidobacteriaceae bacterium]|nr:formate dehydrogenase accessory sulfurtransferase FdhD [Acidobacteriaceae bacterium]
MMIEDTDLPVRQIHLQRVSLSGVDEVSDFVAVEEPMEIKLEFGPADARELRSISVTMRTPGHDEELALGFLSTEGVLGDEVMVDDVRVFTNRAPVEEAVAQTALSCAGQVRVVIAEGIPVRTRSLDRNFYTSSSCGICGKASLQALRSVSPPRRKNTFTMSVEQIFSLPERMREAQKTFEETGGLHAAALFDESGKLIRLREDVGRHNALDKLVGAAFFEDELPLRSHALLLSGRASFELLQKAVMAGIPMVVSVGAPSSLALEVAREFDVTLVGFLRGNRMNIYHGHEHVLQDGTRR